MIAGRVGRTCLLLCVVLLAACSADNGPRPRPIDRDNKRDAQTEGDSGGAQDAAPDAAPDASASADAGVDAGADGSAGDAASDAAEPDAGPECHEAADCADGDPCNDDICDLGRCGHLPLDVVDRDHDGAEDARCGGADCDDANAGVPTDLESCNGVDDDCDGLVDEGLLDDGADVLVAAGDARHLALETSFGAAGFGALWADDDESVTFAALAADGSTVRGPLSLGGTAVADSPGDMALVGTPSGFMAAWCEDGASDHLAIALIPNVGEPEPPLEIAVDSSFCHNVSGAFSGEVVALAWTIVHDLELRPATVLLSIDGAEMAEATIHEQVALGQSVDVEWLGDAFGVFFRADDELLGDGGKLLLLGADGAIGELIAFSDGPAILADVAWDGARGHIIWQTASSQAILYRVISNTGLPVEQEAQLAWDGAAPAIASAGAGCLAAWMATELEVAPVGGGGAGTSIQPSDLNRAPSAAALAADALGYGVLWSEDAVLMFDRVECAR